MAASAELELAQAVLIRIAVIVLMVSLGMRVSPSAIVISARRRGAFVTTLVLALVIVPMAAWGLVRLLGLPSEVAAGIVLVAASPGGSLGLKLVDLARGDVALGLGLFFVLALVAPFSVPITAAVLAGFGAEVDPRPLVLTLLVIQCVPLLLAIGVARVAPGPARRIGALATTATTLLLVALIGVVLVVNFDETLAIGPGGVAAYVGLILGTLVAGLLAGRADPRIGRAIAFLSAQRSTSLALLIATTIGVPGVTGAVVAGGLILLVLNPLAARLLGARGGRSFTTRPGLGRDGVGVT